MTYFRGHARAGTAYASSAPKLSDANACSRTRDRPPHHHFGIRCGTTEDTNNSALRYQAGCGSLSSAASTTTVLPATARITLHQTRAHTADGNNPMLQTGKEHDLMTCDWLASVELAGHSARGGSCDSGSRQPVRLLASIARNWRGACLRFAARAWKLQNRGLACAIRSLGLQPRNSALVWHGGSSQVAPVAKRPACSQLVLMHAQQGRVRSPLRVRRGRGPELRRAAARHMCHNDCCPRGATSPLPAPDGAFLPQQRITRRTMSS
jgi:hypothetical protein